jgi:hypothetical protein
MSNAEKKDPSGTEPGAQAPGMVHEADIGSGEKSPGEHETDAMIKSIPATPKDEAPATGGKKA